MLALEFKDHSESATLALTEPASCSQWHRIALVRVPCRRSISMVRPAARTGIRVGDSVPSKGHAIRSPPSGSGILLATPMFMGCNEAAGCYDPARLGWQRRNGGLRALQSSLL